MAKALKIAHKKEWGQILYTKERMSQKLAAEKVGVTEKTFKRWREKGNWDKLRKSFLNTKATQVQRLYDIIDNLTTRIELDELQGNSKEADKLIKYTTSLNLLETETNLGQIIEVGQKFIGFVSQNDFEDAKRITTLFDAFIQSRLR